MAAGPWELYEITNVKLQKGLINWESDSFECSLLIVGYSKNLALQDFMDDVVAFEVPGSQPDYARKPIAGKVVSDLLVPGSAAFNATSPIDFGDVVDIQAKWAVISRVIGTDATDELLFVCDLNTDSGSADLQSTQGNFDIALNANGFHVVTPNQ